MNIYTTTLPSLPNWHIKVRTTRYNGSWLAIVSVPTATGMVTLNKEHASEHVALHRAIDTIDELLTRLLYPRAELERMN